MWHGWKKTLLFSWLITTTITGYLLFCGGFLLSRLELGLKSSCKRNAVGDIKSFYASHPGCLSERRFTKAVIIVIDALRYDFMVYNESLAFQHARPFQNRLPIVNHLLKSSPQKTALYKFMADPPTTTMQRIKGLTTGSLPTFVDAGSNFASQEINEDNILYQMKQLGMQAVFMGDDTWVGLYPREFLKVFSYPSLNVVDLHTVDNGVNEHLLPEIRNGDWNLIIGHFLGVDHCGHTFGPDHPEMSRKLDQMNEVINDLVHEISNDTILFIMGDHGMTKTGDHGGDSIDELEAALFMYSPKDISVTKQGGSRPVVSQIDFVPTLSLLMGLPIPFSNLGSVMPDLLYAPIKESTASKEEFYFCHYLKALTINAQQVSIYLQSYIGEIDEFPPEKFSYFQEILDDAENMYNTVNRIVCTNTSAWDSSTTNLDHLHEIIKKYEAYLTGTKEMCKEIWAKFDLVFMVIGILVVLLMLVIGFIIARNDEDDLINGIFSLVVILFSFLYSSLIIVSTLLRYKVNREVAGILIIYSAVIYIVICLYNLRKYSVKEKFSSVCSNVDFTSAMSWCLAACWLFLHFSNSFTVKEDQVTLFCCQTYILCLTGSCISKLQQERKMQNLKTAHKNNKRTYDIGYVITSPEMFLTLMYITLSVILRVLFIWKGCREEQHECVENDFLRPLSTILEDDKFYRNMRFFMAMAVISAYVYLMKYWLKRNGSLQNGFMVNCISYLLPTGAAAIIWHWLTQLMLKRTTDQLTTSVSLTAGPQFMYWIFILIIITCFIKPLCLYVRERNNVKETPLLYPHQKVVPQLFHYIKLQLKHNKRSSHIKDQVTQSKPPLVYGLGTVYSAPIIVLYSFLALLLVLLLGDGFSATILLYTFATFLYLELTATHMTLVHPSDQNKRTSPMFRDVLGWCMLTSYLFFTTGHQHTVTAVNWGAAYTGFKGDFKYHALPGLLIVLNTFAGHVLGCIILPLLVLWPAMRGKSIFCYTPTSEITMSEKGEFSLAEEGTAVDKVYRLSVQTFAIFGAKTAAAMLAAGLHRRHLMVWKIFAPRFIFDCVALIVVAVCLLISCTIVTRINSSIVSWVKNLEAKQERENMKVV